MNDKQFEIINDKLDKLVKLLGIQALEGKDISEQFEMLSNVGFQPKEIAEITGKTNNQVSVTLSKLKNKKKNKREGKK